MDINVPAPATDKEYHRADCLLEIINSAVFQLHQDSLGVEQEDLALTSRLNAINVQLELIRRNDPLLK
jgi:hypothetical protein